jgi:hypothetical protein
MMYQSFNILKNLSGSPFGPLALSEGNSSCCPVGQAYYACKQNAGISFLAGLTAGITQEAQSK